MSARLRFHIPPLLLGLFLLNMPLAAMAEEKPPTVVPATAPVVASATAPNISATILDLAVDRGIPLTLSAPAASVFIANPDIADIQVMSPTSIMVFGKRTGQTTLMATDNDGKTLLHRTVMVSQNLTDLRISLNTVIPGNKIKAEAVPNGIVLTGEAKDPGVVEDARRLAMRYVSKDGEIINRIKVKGSNQIQIRVRFAEVSRDVDKRFGINWETIGNVGSFALGIASGSNFLQGNNMNNLLGRNRPTTGSNSNNIISFSNSGQGYNLNGLIDALALDGFVTLLAEPNLTAMSGETANFLAGGEFPIPVPQSSTTTTIEWKQYGVQLAFTPTLIGEDRINLHVRPEVSQLTDVGAITLNNITVPALTTRRAETSIELGSGQSFVIGGLLNNNQTQTVNKYPFLGDMPILGPLFRSSRFQNNETELVIIITPYIVKPSNEEQLALPMDGFSPPSDVDRIFRMRSSNSDPNARVISGTPRARLEPPALPATSLIPGGFEAPIPDAAPTESVIQETSPATLVNAMPKQSLPATIPVPMAAPVPTPSRFVPSASPAGPGGFILE